jgi:hypothetical protein
MNPCPNCGSHRIVTGRLVEYGCRNAAVFRPDSLRFLAVTSAGGAALSKQSLACRDCGLVWNLADKDKLNRFLQRHCDGLDDNRTI